MIRFHVISLFPDSIRPYVDSSILGRAQSADLVPKGAKKPQKPKISVSYYDPKDFSRDKYGRVDRRPYGGGPGMVLEPEAVLRAARKAIGRKSRAKVIFFSPSGEQFDEAAAQELSKEKDVVFICGRYEGVDERVSEILGARSVSIGPYVLTGGELPAAVMIDAIARHVPGVLGKAESLESARVASPAVYTRPEILKWKGKRHAVPEILKSGNHGEIEKWKRSKKLA